MANGRKIISEPDGLEEKLIQAMYKVVYNLVKKPVHSRCDGRWYDVLEGDRLGRFQGFRDIREFEELTEIQSDQSEEEDLDLRF